jgi:hypothetical protein
MASSTAHFRVLQRHCEGTHPGVVIAAASFRARIEIILWQLMVTEALYLIRIEVWPLCLSQEFSSLLVCDFVLDRPFPLKMIRVD